MILLLMKRAFLASGKSLIYDGEPTPCNFASSFHELVEAGEQKSNAVSEVYYLKNDFAMSSHYLLRPPSSPPPYHNPASSELLRIHIEPDGKETKERI